MFQIEDKEKERLLLTISENSDISLDELIAVYLIIGDDLFFLFKVLKGKIVKFPIKQTFNGLTTKDRIIIHEVPVNTNPDIKEMEVEGVLYDVFRKPRKILNHYYVVLKEQL